MKNFIFVAILLVLVFSPARADEWIEAPDGKMVRIRSFSGTVTAEQDGSEWEIEVNLRPKGGGRQLASYSREEEFTEYSARGKGHHEGHKRIGYEIPQRISQTRFRYEGVEHSVEEIIVDQCNNCGQQVPHIRGDSFDGKRCSKPYQYGHCPFVRHHRVGARCRPNTFLGKFLLGMAPGALPALAIGLQGRGQRVVNNVQATAGAAAVAVSAPAIQPSGNPGPPPVPGGGPGNVPGSGP